MVITVPWANQNEYWWNNIVADIMVHFGLPGGKYSTEVTEDYMKFTFHDDRDALLCQIMISDKIQ